jgi:hypothetical protein
VAGCCIIGHSERIVPIFIDRGAPLWNTILPSNAAVLALDVARSLKGSHGEPPQTTIGPTLRIELPTRRTEVSLHGGLSPGAPRGRKNGSFRSGDWTAEAIEERKWARSLARAFAQKGQGS